MGVVAPWHENDEKKVSQPPLALLDSMRPVGLLRCFIWQAIRTAYVQVQ